MKEFTLHDGEDEKRTAELHTFIDEIGEDHIFDWEGDESGITLMVNVRVGVGDTIVFDGDQVTIRRKQK